MKYPITFEANDKDYQLTDYLAKYLWTVWVPW